LLGRTEEALEHFKIAEKARPDDASIALNIGHCLMELDRTKEALNYLFKVEFVGKKPERAYRPLAWALLLTGDVTRSLEYSERVLAGDAGYVDYLHAGYAHLLSGDMQKATEMFAQSQALFKGDFDEWLEYYRAELPKLYPLGLDRMIPALLADIIRYRHN
jgi:tetratricopeptide (TPR) repeat protein